MAVLIIDSCWQFVRIWRHTCTLICNLAADSLLLYQAGGIHLVSVADSHGHLRHLHYKARGALTDFSQNRHAHSYVCTRTSTFTCILLVVGSWHPRHATAGVHVYLHRVSSMYSWQRGRPGGPCCSATDASHW